MIFQKCVWFLSSIFCVFSSLPPFLSDPLICSDTEYSEQEFELELKIEDNVAACQNLYEYSCKKWKKRIKKPNFEPFWNNFVATSYKIKNQIQKILEQSDNVILEKPKKFYKACINSEQHEMKYLNNLKLLIKYFNNWPIVTNSWQHEGFDWLEQVAEITRILGIHPILKFSVNIDYKNTSRYSLYAEPGNLVFPQHILASPNRFSAELSSYVKWILETISYLYPNSKKRQTLKLEVLKIVDFEIKLAKLISGRTRIEKLTVQEMSQKYRTNFSKVTKNIFGDVNVKILETDTVIIKHANFLKNLLVYLKNIDGKIIETDTVIIKHANFLKNLLVYLKNIDGKIIANYLVWAIVQDLSRETTNYMRTLNFHIDKAILGVTSDLSRNVECLDKTIQYFSYAILPVYVNSHFDQITIQDVEAITSNVKKEFVNVLKNNEWLGVKTSILAMEKIENIKPMIGYPKWIEKEELLVKYYENITISNDHLSNIIMAKNYKVAKNLANLHSTVLDPVWPTNVFEVNAYYSVLQNAIFIPIGLLDAPFYFQDSSRTVYNYGRLGSLIGHELAHALDSSGRQADQNGIITKWWTQKDIAAYRLKTKCFEKQYQSTNMLNIGENIADHVGLQISYKSFEKSIDHEYIADKNIKRRLFFITYAQMWCEVSNQNDLYFDEHASVESRVNQAVLNNPNFSEIFKCQNNNVSINYNCKLW